MSETDKQMPQEIWTDINGHATRTQFNGGVRYIRAAEYDALREQNRVLRLEFQSLLNVIDDSYDEDLPVEIVEARNKAQVALTATSQPKEVSE